MAGSHQNNLFSFRTAQASSVEVLGTAGKQQDNLQKKKAFNKTTRNIQ